jgi:VanZ family protein
MKVVGGKPDGLVAAMLRVSWLASVLFVVVMSLLPRSEVPELNLSDKFEHFAAYTGVALLGGLCVRSRLWKFALIPVAAIALGVVLEFLQLYVPGRSLEAADALANAAGAASGAVLSIGVRGVFRWV